MISHRRLRCGVSPTLDNSSLSYDQQPPLPSTSVAVLMTIFYMELYNNPTPTPSPDYKFIQLTGLLQYKYQYNRFFSEYGNELLLLQPGQPASHPPTHNQP